MKNLRSWESTSVALLILTVCLVLGGCGGSSGSNAAPTASATSTATPTPKPTQSASLDGTVMGGIEPINGATVNIYAAGGNYGAGVSLLATAKTNANGQFSATFGCAPVTSQIYLTASGGDAGAGTNTAIGLMAIAGDCTATTFPQSVTVNEFSTVAAIWPTSAFNSTTTGTTYAATLGGPPTGFLNALATVGQLVNNTTGQPVSTPPAPLAGTGGIPISKLNTLADILAACVQTNGARSTACTSLFTAANLPTKPTNTLSAALNIARNPATNVSTIFGIVCGAPPCTPGVTGPFQPSLTTAPAAWTIALNWTGGGLTNPYGAAIDASGNVWATNAGTAAAPGTTVSELSPSTGTFLSGSGGFDGGGNLNGPEGIAIDNTANVWVANTCPGCSTAPNSVTKLTSKGALSKNFTTNLSGPLGIAIDQNANVWVANTVASSGSFLLSENIKGTGTSFTTFTNSGLSGPMGAAIDQSGNVWLSNNDAGSGTTITNFLPASSQFANFSLNTGQSGPTGLEIGPYGNLWVVGQTSNSITEFSLQGAIITPTGLAPSLTTPAWLAIDSSGNLWITNNGGNSITEIVRGGTAIAPTYTSLTPFTNASAPMNKPQGLYIDLSGNVWVANNGGNSLTEFLGAAAPVQTPVIGIPGKPTPISGGAQG